MRFARSALAVSSLMIVAACSSSPASPTGGTTSSGAGAGTTSSGAGAGGSGGGFDAGATVTSYMTGLGPVPLDSGVEQTVCATVRLGNMDGGYVRRFVADLSEGTHHMIVYTSTSTTEAPTPVPCQPLAGILQGQHPVFIAQQAHAELVFPNDENGTPVGFQIAPNQMVKIEVHMINTTQAPLMVTGSAKVDTVPLSTTVTPTDLAFWGTKQINIPANASFDTGVHYQAGIPGTKSFAVTTHQHHLGTEMQVWYSTGTSDTANLVADGKNWNDPPLVMLDPALDFPADGSKGFAYDCHYVNTTPNTVKFGESFNDEMCFLWHYYYPSQGFRFCIDGLCN